MEMIWSSVGVLTGYLRGLVIWTGYSRRCRCSLIVVDRYEVAFALESTALVAQKLCALTKPPCNDDLALSLFHFSGIAHFTISYKYLPRF